MPFATIFLMRGVLSFRLSNFSRPSGVAFHLRNHTTSPNIPAAISQPYPITALLSPIKMRVGNGKAPPIDANTFSKSGMIHTSAPITPKTPSASTMHG